MASSGLRRPFIQTRAEWLWRGCWKLRSEILKLTWKECFCSSAAGTGRGKLRSAVDFYHKCPVLYYLKAFVSAVFVPGCMSSVSISAEFEACYGGKGSSFGHNHEWLSFLFRSGMKITVCSERCLCISWQAWNSTRKESKWRLMLPSMLVVDAHQELSGPEPLPHTPCVSTFLSVLLHVCTEHHTCVFIFYIMIDFLVERYNGQFSLW